MNDANSPPDDSISALADGALAGSARAQAAQCVLTSAQGLQTWHTYHVIGDVLRSAELAPRGDEQAFWGRLSQKIAMEPAHPLQEPASDVPDRVYPQGTNSAIPILSANDAVWRWKWLAGVACAALGGVLGLGLWGAGTNPTQMANAGGSGIATPVMSVVQGRNGPMLRDPQLDSLMAAHRQVSGHSALPLPAGFLRNATYEGSER